MAGIRRTASSRELSATPQVVSEANALDDWEEAGLQWTNKRWYGLLD